MQRKEELRKHGVVLGAANAKASLSLAVMGITLLVGFMA